VNPETATTLGRLGRSFGCPALRPAVTKPLLDTLKNGQYVFSYYPNANWLAASTLLNCGKATANTSGGAIGAGANAVEVRPDATRAAAP
jgi:hypothetical protein